MGKLEKGKRYFDIAAHRYVYYERTRTSTWAGEKFEEYIFTDICGCIIKHKVEEFDINKWLVEEKP